jgi:hypothetical protein
MAKPRTELAVLSSITKALDGLTAQERTRVLLYVLDKYQPKHEASGK